MLSAIFHMFTIYFNGLYLRTTNIGLLYNVKNIFDRVWSMYNFDRLFTVKEENYDVFIGKVFLYDKRMNEFRRK